MHTNESISHSPNTPGLSVRGAERVAERGVVGCVCYVACVLGAERSRWVLSGLLMCW